MTTREKERSFFRGKWYVREDFCEEPFDVDSKWSRISTKFFNSLLSLNNCFDTRQEARDAANRIRKLMNAPLLPEKLDERELSFIY